MKVLPGQIVTYAIQRSTWGKLFDLIFMVMLIATLGTASIIWHFKDDVVLKISNFMEIEEAKLYSENAMRVEDFLKLHLNKYDADRIIVRHLHNGLNLPLPWHPLFETSIFEVHRPHLAPIAWPTRPLSSSFQIEKLFRQPCYTFKTQKSPDELVDAIKRGVDAIVRCRIMKGNEMVGYVSVGYHHPVTDELLRNVELELKELSKVLLGVIVSIMNREGKTDEI